MFTRTRQTKTHDVHEIRITRCGEAPCRDHGPVAGGDELIEIRHTAQSRSIFANGAVRAAKFIVEQDPGLYSMKILSTKLSILQMKNKHLAPSISFDSQFLSIPV